jgi:hypothetical protein
LSDISADKQYKSICEEGRALLKQKKITPKHSEFSIV